MAPTLEEARVPMLIANTRRGLIDHSADLMLTGYQKGELMGPLP